jgi:NAD(P)-dependent dehydrogenase (short-subunit alcohol dehydrogenase family)
VPRSSSPAATPAGSRWQRGKSARASLLGDKLEERRDELRATLPIGRVVGPADVAALAVHIMTNTALTGATYDIDGGQQLVS